MLAVWVSVPVTRVVPAPVICPPDHANVPPKTNVPVPPSVPADIVVAPLAVTVPVALTVPPLSVTPVSFAPSSRSNVPACNCTPANSPVEPLPPPSSSTFSTRPSLSIAA